MVTHSPQVGFSPKVHTVLDNVLFQRQDGTSAIVQIQLDPHRVPHSSLFVSWLGVLSPTAVVLGGGTVISRALLIGYFPGM
ncbi:hypothetical protein GDO86_006903 [Hymenochirus boettgeri]|uniref:Uncharacterized protein n=1 Tax=Hymenochirus boettgeri TaxID=247094 RepID=A0A8T2JCX2_9PIPI|nr:hypothetical protein GDO86_006903 [Hymenochirus boettgeri]